MPEDETPTPVSNTNPSVDGVPKEPSLEVEPSSTATSLDTTTETFTPSPKPEPMTSSMQDSSLPPSQNTMSMGAQKKSKKKWIIGGLAALIVVLFGGSAFAYFAWYQSPDKVLSDALLNVLSQKNQSGITKATIAVKSKQVDVVIKTDAKSNEKVAEAAVDIDVTVKEGVDKPLNFKIKADAFVDVDKEVIYIKLKDVDSLVEKLVDVVIDAQLEQASLYSQQKPTAKEIAALRKQILKQYEPIVKKIDNQWIKIDTNKESGDEANQKCFSDAYDKLRDNKEVQKELLDVYSKNKFLEVKDTLPTQNGQLGYVLDLDKAKLEKFADAAEKTEIGKALAKCDEAESPATSSPFAPTPTESESDFKNTTVEVRIDQWAHTLNGIKVETEVEENGDKATLSVDATVEYKDVGELAAPKDAVDIEELMNDFLSGAVGGPSATTVPTNITGQQSI